MLPPAAREQTAAAFCLLPSLVLQHTEPESVSSMRAMYAVLILRIKGPDAARCHNVSLEVQDCANQ